MSADEGVLSDSHSQHFPSSCLG